MMIPIQKNRTLFTLSLFILFCGNLYSQNVEIKVDSNLFYLRQPFSASIIIENGKPDDLPNISVLGSHFTVSYLGQSRSSQTTIRNGKKKTIKAIIFNYKLIPLIEGDITIPPIRVPINGEIFFTKALKINVNQQGDVPGFEFKLTKSTNRTNVYPGEPITLEFIILSPVPVGNLSFDGSITKTNNLYSFDGYIINDLQNQGTIVFEGLEFPAGFEWSIINQRRIFLLKISLQITPKSPGTIHIPSENVSFMAAMEKNIFGESVLSTPRFMATDELTLNVLKLPEEIISSPNGIILSEGELKCEAKSSASRLLQGDPLTYTIDFSDITNLESVIIPGFPANQAIMDKLNGRFSINSTGSLRNKKLNDKKTDISGNKKYFYRATEVLVPLSEAISEIPSIPFTYFNLITGEVATTKTNPVKLEILPANSVGLDLNTNLDNNQDNLQDLTQNNENNPAFGNFFPDFTPKEILSENYQSNGVIKYLWYILFLPIPPVLFIILLLQKRNKNIHNSNQLDYTPAEQRKTITKLKKLISEEPTEFDLDMLEELIKNYQKTKASKQLLNFCEALRYKGTPPNNKDIQDVISLTNTLIDEYSQLKGNPINRTKMRRAKMETRENSQKRGYQL